MRRDDLSYFRARAEVEREQARQATCEEAARAHSELASAYLQRIAAAGSAGRPRHA